MTTMDYFSGRGMTDIIPDNWSPQNRYLGGKAEGKRAHTLTQGPDTASLTLIKYEDYECTCNALWETVIELGLGIKFAIGIFSFSTIEGLCSYE